MDHQPAPPTDDDHRPSLDALAAAYRDAHDPVGQAHAVWAVLRSSPDLEPSSVERLGATIDSFAARQATLGRRRLSDIHPEDAAGFIWARTRRGRDPAVATIHLRRTALRVLVRSLTQLGDPPASDPTAELALPPRTRSDIRPLDSGEIALLRIAATSKPRSGDPTLAALAAAEATATTGEIAQLRWHHLDRDLTRLQLPGTGSIRPRTGQLTAWGRQTLTRCRPEPYPPDGLLVYRGSAPPGSQPSQAAVVNRLRRLLTLAGLAAPDVRPTSIRLWPAAELLAAGHPIEDAANLLGLTSLDVAATQLGHRWQTA